MAVLSTEPDVLFLLSEFEEALRENGFVLPSAPGAGAVAAQRVYSSLVPA